MGRCVVPSKIFSILCIITLIYNFLFLVSEFSILYYICIPFSKEKINSDQTRRGG
jgi:hypothetical protein